MLDRTTDLPIAENLKNCEQCGNQFTPRERSGGKPQRFCSQDCRYQFHAQRDQRSPTWSALEAVCDPPVEEKPAALPAAKSDFDWSDPACIAECVALRHQPATAVYFNPDGDLIIRQRCWPDEDPVII